MAEIRCPRCGSPMIVITDREEDRRYYVCVNRPGCAGKIAADEALGYVWGEERPFVTGAAGGTWQSTKPSSKGRERDRLEESKPWFMLLFKRSKRRVNAGEAGGHDRGREIHEPKLPRYSPQRLQARKKREAYGVKGAPESRPLQSKGTAYSEPLPLINQSSHMGEDGWGSDWDDEAPAPGAVAHKPRRWKIFQPASREPGVLTIRNVTHNRPEMQQPGSSEKEAAVGREVSPWSLSEASPQQGIVPEDREETPEEKKPARRWWRRARREKAAPEIEKLSGTRQDGVPSVDVHSDEKQSLSQEQPRLPAEEVSSEMEDAVEGEGPSKPWWRRALKRKVSLKEKEPAGPGFQPLSAPASIPEITGPAGPLRMAAPAAVPVEPQQPLVPNEDLTPGKKAPFRPHLRIAHGPEITSEAQESPEPRARRLKSPRKTASAKGNELPRHWWQRAPRKKEVVGGGTPAKSRPQAMPKKEAVVRVIRPSKPQPQTVSKKGATSGVKRPLKPRRQAVPKKEAIVREKRPLKPQPQAVLKKEAAPARRKAITPSRQPADEPSAVSAIIRPAMPVEAEATRAYRPERVKESFKPRPRDFKSSGMAARKKRRMLVRLIIAFVVVSLATDVMVCVAVLLK